MASSLTYRHKCALITLNCPQKLNALSSADYVVLAKQMREVASRDDVYITLLIGTGRFFSAGVDVKKSRASPIEGDMRMQSLLNLSHITDVSEAFYTHPKVLVTALNGPVIGLSAALVAYSDFIYAMPHTYLLAPFTSLGIAAEGGSSAMFVQRLGWAKANEALLMSKRISCAELVQCGFINEVFDTNKDSDLFQTRVLETVKKQLGSHLNPTSILKNKALMRRHLQQVLDAQTLSETLAVADIMTASLLIRQQSQEIASSDPRSKL